MSAGVLYSGRHGFADVWLPLRTDAGAPTGALLRVQLQARDAMEERERAGRRTQAEHHPRWPLRLLLFLPNGLSRLRPHRGRAAPCRFEMRGVGSPETGAPSNRSRCSNLQSSRNHLISSPVITLPQAEWFGAQKTLSHAEETALLLLQRALRRMKDKRREVLGWRSVCGS